MYLSHLSYLESFSSHCSPIPLLFSLPRNFLSLAIPESFSEERRASFHFWAVTKISFCHVNVSPWERGGEWGRGCCLTWGPPGKGQAFPGEGNKDFWPRLTGLGESPWPQNVLPESLIVVIITRDCFFSNDLYKLCQMLV